MQFDLSREWLETNGIGGFASGTLINCNARRYHAAFCPATQPPLGRIVLVNRLNEALHLDTPNGMQTFELGCNQYPNAIHPAGYQWLNRFELDPLPRWVYVIPAQSTGLDEDVVFQKTLWMPHERNATVITYELLSEHYLSLSARPFVTGRDYHGIYHANSDFNGEVEDELSASQRTLTMRPHDGLPPLMMSGDFDFCAEGAWYYDFQYAIEGERGLDWREDAYCPGVLRWELSPDNVATVVLSTENVDMAEMRGTKIGEIGRRRALRELSERVGAEDEMWVQRLAQGADQFIVRRRDQLHTILAGYPWFSDWGRDTMIALPGLCLTTRREGEALSILLAFAGAVSQGMIPNRFPDAGEIPDYNTIDATLWFFHAVGEYLKARPNDCTAMMALYPTLRECLEWHWRGTRYNICADESDGLLRGGDADSNTQLTWMDAKVGDIAFTPRAGKPVEIQALWYNALNVGEQLALAMNDNAFAAKCKTWHRRAKTNFAAQFWNEERNCLYDFIDGDNKNGQIRPNQIFAVSLPYRLLPQKLEKCVVETVQRELLTPYGLRSLNAGDPAYRGIYLGDQWQRDSSYHQGTVWGWLMGPFLSAYLRVNRNSNKSRLQAREWLQPLLNHLDEAGINSISEIFDGDAPHHPRGTPAQAWSVAETLRVLVDELA